MAIGFSYTLKPDEAESLKELKSFMGKATELSKFALKIDQTKASIQSTTSKIILLKPLNFRSAGAVFQPFTINAFFFG